MRVTCKNYNSRYHVSFQLSPLTLLSHKALVIVKTPPPFLLYIDDT